MCFQFSFHLHSKGYAKANFYNNKKTRYYFLNLLGHSPGAVGYSLQPSYWRQPEHVDDTLDYETEDDNDDEDDDDEDDNGDDDHDDDNGHLLGCVKLVQKLEVWRAKCTSQSADNTLMKWSSMF